MVAEMHVHPKIYKCAIMSIRAVLTGNLFFFFFTHLNYILIPTINNSLKYTSNEKKAYHCVKDGHNVASRKTAD